MEFKDFYQFIMDEINSKSLLKNAYYDKGSHFKIKDMEFCKDANIKRLSFTRKLEMNLRGIIRKRIEFRRKNI